MSGWNKEYWQGANPRAEKAKIHHNKMIAEYKNEILEAVNNTEIWDDSRVSSNNADISGEPSINVTNNDTVSQTMLENKGRTVVLNFASYKNPGGGFLKGSGAQEEALCHESFLYEVLSNPALSNYYEFNKAHNNQNLYTNRALYTPDVLFIKNGQKVKADVITCASPNRMAYTKYTPNASEEKNFNTLKRRIHFIGDIIRCHMTGDNPVTTAVLGAFGCGVFAQNPETVAKLFKEEFENTPIKTVYAVIDKGGHSKEGAYAIFNRIFSQFTE